MSLKMVKKFFDTNPDFLVKHQTDSYNYFMYEIIPNIIKNTNPLTLKDDENREILINYGGENGDEIFYIKPFYTPNECRQRNLSYLTTVKCNILILYLGNKNNNFNGYIYHLEYANINLQQETISNIYNSTKNTLPSKLMTYSDFYDKFYKTN